MPPINYVLDHDKGLILNKWIKDNEIRNELIDPGSPCCWACSMLQKRNAKCGCDSGNVEIENRKALWIIHDLQDHHPERLANTLREHRVIPSPPLALFFVSCTGGRGIFRVPATSYSLRVDRNNEHYYGLPVFHLRDGLYYILSSKFEEIVTQLGVALDYPIGADPMERFRKAAWKSGNPEWAGDLGLLMDDADLLFILWAAVSLRDCDSALTDTINKLLEQDGLQIASSKATSQDLEEYLRTEHLEKFVPLSCQVQAKSRAHSIRARPSARRLETFKMKTLQKWFKHRKGKAKKWHLEEYWNDLYERALTEWKSKNQRNGERNLREPIA